MKLLRRLLIFTLLVTTSFSQTYVNSQGFRVDGTGAVLMTIAPVLPTYTNSKGFLIDANGAVVVTGVGSIANDFFAVAGPATTTKTFTFPNANSTVNTGTGTDNVIPKFTTGASGILGNSALTDNATNVISTEGVQLPNGTCATSGGVPSLFFAASATAGLCSQSATAIRFLAGGIDEIQLGAAGLTQNSNNEFGWSSSTTNPGTFDTGFSRKGAGFVSVDSSTNGNFAGFTKSALTAILTADWTCGTGGTASSCVSATTIGTLTFTLPLVATNWSFDCKLIVGQATAATANNWSLQTATNGATNLAAAFLMNTAATAVTSGALTGQGSTTSSVDITGTWTLGAIGTKMPVIISGTVEGASASGTVLNIQLKAPTVADLVTIYRGSKCTLNP